MHDNNVVVLLQIQKNVLVYLTGANYDTLHTTLSVFFYVCVVLSVCLCLSVRLGLFAGIEMHHEAHVCGIRFWAFYICRLGVR